MSSIQASDDSAGKRPRILIVDDHPDLREMLIWALEYAGYEPLGAGDGQEALVALARAAQDGRTPHVILLDLEMPVMDGWTFLQRFLVECQDLSPLPQIVVTSAIEGAGTLTATFGVREVVPKPYTVRQVLAVLAALCLGGTGA